MMVVMVVRMVGMVGIVMVVMVGGGWVVVHHVQAHVDEACPSFLQMGSCVSFVRGGPGLVLSVHRPATQLMVESQNPPEVQGQPSEPIRQPAHKHFFLHIFTHTYSHIQTHTHTHTHIRAARGGSLVVCV